MTQIAQLLALADEFSAATGLKDKTISFRVFGDSKKLAALRAGGDITTGRFRSALEWFSGNWPPAASWPSNVVRPKVAA